MRIILRHGIYMLKNRGHAQNQNLNIGKWLSAKIYSDMKNGCSCKANDWLYEEIRGLKDYSIPVCKKCNQYPELFVIVARVKDENGVDKRVRIRHTQEGKRLKDYLDVSYTLRNVLREMETNTFDVRRYESEESRESFKFQSVVESYLAHHESRLLIGKISPAGLKDKKTIIKNHLDYFNDKDIAFITPKIIKDFYSKSKASERMRDRAVAELKTIMNYALDELELIKYVPKFPEISSSKMVRSDRFITPDQQEIIISKIENPIHKAAIKILALYALRPCEVRSLKWKDIDLHKEVIYIRSHISLGKEIPGRKSVADDVHELPLIDKFREAISVIPRSINENDYLFKGRNGGAIGDNVLRIAWNDACKLARIKNVSLYQGTKHSTLSYLAKNNSDAKLRKLSGHTNEKILHRYAQANLNDIRELLR